MHLPSPFFLRISVIDLIITIPHNAKAAEYITVCMLARFVALNDMVVYMCHVCIEVRTLVGNIRENERYEEELSNFR